MRSKKYGIIIDTNFLGSYKKKSLQTDNFNFLSVDKQLFFSLINFLQDNALTKDIKILIPKIVFEELKEQQNELYLEGLRKLKERFSKFSALNGFKLEAPELDYKLHIDKKIDAFISKYNITVLDYPSNDVFESHFHGFLHKEFES